MSLIRQLLQPLLITSPHSSSCHRAALACREVEAVGRADGKGEQTFRAMGTTPARHVAEPFY